MQKIIPYLWFDKSPLGAVEAAKFYITLFPDSQLGAIDVLKDTPGGDMETVEFTLCGLKVAALSGGPYFKFTPAHSMFVSSTTVEEIDSLWNKLIIDGEVMMPLQKYPFSERYGWLTDKWGLSWQIFLSPTATIEQKVHVNFMFTGAVAGKAEEAVNYYLSIFKNSHINGDISRYGEGQTPNTPEMVNWMSFTLDGVKFSAIDSAGAHNFNFTEAISFMILCESQAEIDYFWEKLSAVPEAEQCGWLKDKWGVSWQVLPKNFDQMMREGTPEQRKRLTDSFMKMKKFDLAEIERAYKGE